MKENKDDEELFKQYQNMSRSMKGLQGAGKWYALKSY